MHTEEMDVFAVQVACALYEAAVAKYEAVLEMDPRNRTILRNCAFAIYDLGRLQPDPASRTARQLLEVEFLAAPAAVPSGRARQSFAAISWRGMKGMCRCSAQRTITTCRLQDTESLHHPSFQVLRLPCCYHEKTLTKPAQSGLPLKDTKRTLKEPTDLQDATRYFQDVLMLSGEDEDVAAALDNCIADLEDARAMS